MSRVIKIVGYVVMLFVLYIGSTTVLESCKGAATGETVVEEGEGDEFASDDEIYDEYFESDEATASEGIEVEEVSKSTADPESKTTKQDAVDDYDEDFSFEANAKEKAKINKPSPKLASKPASKPAAQYSSAGGDFLVVAGSYLIRDNAEKMVGKLKGLGYNGAEIVSFDESQYHSISAGRYSTYDAAGKVAKTLKNKGIDCYVHTRK
jgi:cell division septation protein DedD